MLDDEIWITVSLHSLFSTELVILAFRRVHLHILRWHLSPPPSAWNPLFKALEYHWLSSVNRVSEDLGLHENRVSELIVAVILTNALVVEVPILTSTGRRF